MSSTGDITSTSSSRWCGVCSAIFHSGDPVLRNFGLLLVAVVGMAMFFILAYPMGKYGLEGTPVCTASAAAVGLLAIMAAPFSSSSMITMKKLISRIALIVLVCTCAGLYFGGCNVVTRFYYKLYGEKMLWDSTFLTMDTHLLGFAFPQGQIALYLDQNPSIGPTSFIGRIYAEILQIMYFSYYFWGNAMAVYLLVQYFFLSCKNNSYQLPLQLPRVLQEETSLTQEQQWRRLMMFTTAWTGTYLLNFVMNMVFPAVSPRIYIADQYQNEISGLFFANSIRGALKGAAANSFGAFPSGHCGLSWLAAYTARRLGFVRYAKCAKIAAVHITLATLILRYHYLVDMLCATILLAFGITVGHLYSQEVYERQVMGGAAPTRRS